ncbi:hypothetical protein [uncultured Shewanella sp.]|uniref:hypothetical protein n=1 Tax=uncultured Shewanella sp. TaxID=173975 RepID=UPI00260C206A|nr:hypothetical protein [uncultured Shewanella sp.]
MQFISLWCVKGYDNGVRSAVITGSIYCIILLLSLLLGPTAWLFFFGVLLTPILLLTHRRRLRDSDYPGQWIWLPLLPFIGVIATLVTSDNTVLLLVFISIAVGMMLYFSSLKANRKRVYTQGYAGRSIQLHRGNTGLSQNHRSKKRVEPTLSSEVNQPYQSEQSQDSPSHSSSPQEITATQALSIPSDDINSAKITEPVESSLLQQSAIENHDAADQGETSAANQCFNSDGHEQRESCTPADESATQQTKWSRKWPFISQDLLSRLRVNLNEIKDKIQKSDRKVIIYASSVFVLALMLVFWLSINRDGSAELTQASASLPEPLVERHEAKLPDGFSLVFENNILIMRWLGEVQDPQELWSLAQAKGDKTCAELTFNNGVKYRPLSVVIKPDTAIEARFSPLDNAAIITDVAKRGSVSLCGYQFSLKGSLAVLGKNPIFGDYL